MLSTPGFFKGLRGLRQPVGAVKAPTGPLIPGSGATKLPAYPLVRIVSLASNASDGWMTLFHPFSSDKIRTKILDLGYGGARRALYNLCPKSARILSAAITRCCDLAPRRLGLVRLG